MSAFTQGLNVINQEDLEAVEQEMEATAKEDQKQV